MTEQQPNLPDRSQMRASHGDRDRVARTLQDAMSEGRIDAEELDERLGVVYGAKTLGELEPVTADLPRAAPHGAPEKFQAQSVDGPDSRIGGVPGSTASIGILSGADRKGNWTVPGRHNSFAFWGGVNIDLRDARFAEQYSTITAVAIMGGVEIVVPDDIIVEVTGIGFMGAFESQIQERDRGKPANPGPNAPVVRINGFAFWGAVTVIRRPRNEPAT